MVACSIAVYRCFLLNCFDFLAIYLAGDMPVSFNKEVHVEVETTSANSATWCGTCIVNEKENVLANEMLGLFIIKAEASLS